MRHARPDDQNRPTRRGRRLFARGSRAQQRTGARALTVFFTENQPLRPCDERRSRKQSGVTDENASISLVVEHLA